MNMLTASMAALAVGSTVFAQSAVEWRVADGGNGHWYQIIDYPTGKTHAEALSLARQTGAGLVSFGSAAELAFVEPFAVTYGPFAAFTIGGRQDTSAPDYSEPSGGWRWEDGTPWTFTNWDCGVCAQQYGSGWWCQPDNYINQHFAGLEFETLRQRMQQELLTLRDELTSLLHKAVDAGEQAVSQEHETVMISGERNLVACHELTDNLDRLRQLFGVFEAKTSLVQLLDASSRAEGVQIFIGGESQLVPMDQLSVVLAPYGADGKIVGTLGVIGPTRMAYERVIPIVDITARLVSSALAQS